MTTDKATSWELTAKQDLATTGSTESIQKSHKAMPSNLIDEFIVQPNKLCNNRLMSVLCTKHVPLEAVIMFWVIVHFILNSYIVLAHDD